MFLCPGITLQRRLLSQQVLILGKLEQQLSSSNVFLSDIFAHWHTPVVRRVCLIFSIMAVRTGELFFSHNLASQENICDDKQRRRVKSGRKYSDVFYCNELRKIFATINIAFW